ncbi:galactoside-binding lectin [Necator americanus]|uniref:Galectin n=1 Tax=Necator americanus TaxID=51031 RepID=W2TH03_NECAM|nr:galactoside-binding lectin [Necator americanus]ETN80277.1 galactoside-binding lectin [Necator americanus]
MYTVNCPSVPVAIPICEPLHPGCFIDVYGNVENGNFVVELLSGPHIVLHVNFRFQLDEQEVVMNSSSNGVWGEEIDVNGQHLANYRHRFPMESVQAIGLKGDMCIERIEFDGFLFHSGWDYDTDYGHSGYKAYGTDFYQAPVKFSDATLMGILFPSQISWKGQFRIGTKVA